MAVVALVAGTKIAVIMTIPTTRHKQHRILPVHQTANFLLPPMVLTHTLHVSVLSKIGPGFWSCY